MELRGEGGEALDTRKAPAYFLSENALEFLDKMRVWRETPAAADPIDMPCRRLEYFF